MRNITKGREPTNLTRHRVTPFADYDNYLDKDTLRVCLVSEQRGSAAIACGRFGPVMAP